LIGFFAGLAGATAVGYYFLKNDYEQSTGTINTDITKLVTTVEQLRDYIQRVETVERELKRLQGTVALKQEVDTVRVEVVRAVVSPPFLALSSCFLNRVHVMLIRTISKQVSLGTRHKYGRSRKRCSSSRQPRPRRPSHRSADVPFVFFLFFF